MSDYEICGAKTWFYNAVRLDCELPSGHGGQHQYTIRWTDAK